MAKFLFQLRNPFTELFTRCAEVRHLLPEYLLFTRQLIHLDYQIVFDDIQRIPK